MITLSQRTIIYFLNFLGCNLLQGRMLRLLPLLPILLTGCQSLKTVTTPRPQSAQIYNPTPIFVQEGIASWYGGRWIGRLTANGEHYRAGDITAAHKTLPFNTPVRVTDMKTGASIIVRINNRGPYVKGRIIDLSVAAAKRLGTYDRGLARVRIEALREIPLMEKPNIPPSKSKLARQASKNHEAG